MLLGIGLRYVVIAGGAITFALIVFQILEGKRKIKFKGRLHQKVHRVTAYAILATALIHIYAALVYIGIL
jgi:cytochrome b561